MSNIENNYNDQSKNSAVRQSEEKQEILGTKNINNSYSEIKGNQYGCSPTMTSYSDDLSGRLGISCAKLAECDETLIRSQPDGIATTTPPFTETNTPPPYVKWAEKLRNLLEDEEGVRLFECYLKAEGCQDSLNFWFACQGLKTMRENESEIAQIIRVINRRFIRSSNKLTITNETRQRIQEKISNKNCTLDHHVFDAAQAEVEAAINNTTYPNFLRSDVYLQFVQRMQNEGSDSPKCPEVVSSDSSSGGVSRVGYLQTVNENEELQMEQQAPVSLRLTQRYLQATERQRAGYTESLQNPMGHYLSEGRTVGNPYHALYATCIPVSAQDSELQSLSSDAHTDDTMSQADSTVDGVPTSKKYLMHQHHAMKMNAKQNVENGKDFFLKHKEQMNQYLSDKKKGPPMDPERFATILIQKLESVKEELEKKRKLHEHVGSLQGVGDSEVNQGESSLVTLPSAILKMNISEDSSQAILDDHVNRVFHDCGDQFLHSSSWGPSIQSSENRRENLPTAYAGNISHHKHNHHHSYNKTRLSKSPGEFVNRTLRSGYTDSYVEGYNVERERRIKEHQRHSSSRKISNNSYEDSGIGTINEPIPAVPHAVNSRERVVYWMLGNEKYSSSHHPDSEKDSSTRHRRSSHSSASAGSPVPNHQSRGKKPVAYNSSRSGSLERRSLGNTWPTPTRCIVRDPSMPILPPPNTTTQLEEACRRLEDNAKSKLYRNKPSAAIKEKTVHAEKGRKLGHGNEHTEESGNGMRKNKKLPSTSISVTPDSNENDHTVVGYYFCDEKVPYRTKLPGKSITLHQFKTLITKKGNYRYFFQRRDDEFGSELVNEEVTDDNVVLPLFEGKIIARVELIEES